MTKNNMTIYLNIKFPIVIAKLYHFPMLLLLGSSWRGKTGCFKNILIIFSIIMRHNPSKKIKDSFKLIKPLKIKVGINSCTKRMLVFSILIFANACGSNVKSDWRCGAEQGLNCSPIAGADNPASFANREVTQIDLQENEQLATYNLRKGDKISRVWFAKFIDSDDNLHDESFVYVIDKKSTWQVSNYNNSDNDSESKGLGNQGFH